MRKSLKNLASIVLVIMLLVSCICVGTVAASAAIPSGTTIYFDNSKTNWDEVYVFGWANGLNGAEKMTQITGTNYWSYTFNNGYDGDEFLFKNLSGDTFDQQTSNVTYDVTKNLAIPESASNKTGVTWSTYNPSGETQPTQATDPIILPEKIYITNVANVGWAAGDEVLFAQFIGNSTSDKIDVTAVEGTTDVYEIAVPTGEWTKIVFIRCEKSNPSNEWQRSATINLESEKNLCTFNEDGTRNDWNKMSGQSGEWSVYTPGETPTATETQTETSTATDPTQPVSTTTLYLVPNSNWNKDNARFATYFYIDNNTYTWESMTAVEGETNLYSVAVPEGDWEAVIFCRMNPSTTENKWDNKWNQTSDLLFKDMTGNCYTVAEETWDKGGGSWSTYQVEEPTDPTDPPVPTYTVQIYTQESETPDVYEIKEGGVAVANAPGVEGKKFCYWTDENGRIVTYSRSYGFYVYSDRTLKAVYADNEAEKKPTINITKAFSYKKNNKNYVAFDASRDVPTGYTIVQHGVLFGASASTFGDNKADENLKFANETDFSLKNRVMQCKAKSTAARGLVRLSVNVGSTLDGVVYARGYIVVKDAQGNQSVIYSDVVSRSFNG